MLAVVVARQLTAGDTDLWTPGYQESAMTPHHLAIDIDSLPQLPAMDAAHGALVPHGQLGGATLFDVIVAVIVITGGK